MKKKNEKAVAPSSLWRDAAKRFCKNKTAVVALVILCIMIIAAIFAILFFVLYERMIPMFA